MKSLIEGKVTLNPRFVESFIISTAKHSNIYLMIGWTIGAKIPCPIACMFFNALISSSFNSSIVSKIEKSIRNEVVLLVLTSFKCDLSFPIGVNHFTQSFIWWF